MSGMELVLCGDIRYPFVYLSRYLVSGPGSACKNPTSKIRQKTLDSGVFFKKIKSEENNYKITPKKLKARVAWVKKKQKKYYEFCQP